MGEGEGEVEEGVGVIVGGSGGWVGETPGGVVISILKELHFVCAFFCLFLKLVFQFEEMEFKERYFFKLMNFEDALRGTKISSFLCETPIEQ